MSDNVITLNTIVGDNIKVSPDNVLLSPVGKLEDAVVVGIDKDGDLYCASSGGRGQAIVLLERAKAKLIASWED